MRDTRVLLVVVACCTGCAGARDFVTRTPDPLQLRCTAIHSGIAAPAIAPLVALHVRDQRVAPDYAYRFYGPDFDAVRYAGDLAGATFEIPLYFAESPAAVLARDLSAVLGEAGYAVAAGSVAPASLTVLLRVVSVSSRTHLVRNGQIIGNVYFAAQLSGRDGRQLWASDVISADTIAPTYSSAKRHEEVINSAYCSALHTLSEQVKSAAVRGVLQAHREARASSRARHRERKGVV